MIQVKLKNINTKDVVVFTNYPQGDYVLAKMDLGQISGAHNTTQHINLIGVNVNNTLLEPRDISITGFIRANGKSEMKPRKELLNKLVNPCHDIEICINGHILTFRPDATIGYSLENVENTGYHCKFLIQGTAFYPLFKLKKSSITYESSVKAVPLFPLIIPKKGIAFGYIPAISIKNILNTGDVEAGFIVRFKATGGAVTNPKLVNNLTGKYIEMITSMVLGDEVVVSTLPGNKYAKLIRGSTETDIFYAVRKGSTMGLTLNVGMNDMTATASGNSQNMKTSIEFSPAFLEVQ